MVDFCPEATAASVEEHGNRARTVVRNREVEFAVGIQISDRYGERVPSSAAALRPAERRRVTGGGRRHDAER